MPEITASQVPCIKPPKMSLKLSPSYATARNSSRSRSHTARINSMSNPVAAPFHQIERRIGISRLYDQRSGTDSAEHSCNSPVRENSIVDAHSGARKGKIEACPKGQ